MGWWSGTVSIACFLALVLPGEAAEEEAPAITATERAITEEAEAFFKTALQCGSKFETVADDKHKNVTHRGRLTYEFSGDAKTWKVRHLQYVTSHNSATNKIWEDFSGVTCTSAAYVDLEGAEANGTQLTIRCAAWSGDCISQAVELYGYPFQPGCSPLTVARSTRTYDFCDADVAANVSDVLNELIESSKPSLPTSHTADVARLVPAVGHSSDIYDLGFSEDGRRLATASKSDGSLRVWDWASARVLQVINVPTYPEEITDVGFSRDLRFAAVAAGPVVTVWDLLTGQVHLTLRGSSKSTARAVVFSDDGKLASAHDQNVLVWDVTSGALIATLSSSGSVIDARALAFSTDGALLAESSGNTLKIWDVASGRPIREVRLEETTVAVSIVALCFSPDDTTIAIGGPAMLNLVDIATGRIRSLAATAENWEALSFTRDGRHLISSSFGSGSRVQIRDIASGGVAQELKDLIVRSVVVSPDGSYLALGVYPGYVEIHNVVDGAPVAKLPSAEWYSGFFTPDGRKLVSHDRHAIRLWDLVSGRQLHMVKRPAWVSSDGALAAGRDGEDIRVLDFATGATVQVLRSVAEPIGLLFSPDGRRLATATPNGTISVWDIPSGSLAQRMAGPSATKYYLLLFSPDGTRLVTVAGSHSGPEQYRLWDVDRGRSLPAFKPGDNVSQVAYLPKASRILSWSFIDNQARIWSSVDGSLLKTLEGISERMGALAFSPGGDRLVTAGDDVDILLWDAKGRRIAKLDHGGSVASIAFSPDGSSFVSGGWDGSVKLWNSGKGKPVRKFQGGVGASSITFSPDGSLIAAGETFGNTTIWTTGTENPAAVLSGAFMAFRPDSALVAMYDGGTIRLVDPVKGKLVATLIGEPTGNWIVVTPEGFYSSSEHGAQLLTLVKGDEWQAAETASAALHRPELVEQKLAGNDGAVRDAAAGLDFDGMFSVTGLK